MKCLAMVLLLVGIAIGAQAQKAKPLPVSFSVENEGQNISWPAGVRELGRMDLATLKYDIEQKFLEHRNDSIVLVDPKAPGKQLNVSVVVAQVGKWYVASSVLSFGDEKNSGLLSHNVLMQPTIERLARDVTFQVLSVRLGAMLGWSEK